MAEEKIVFALCSGVPTIGKTVTHLSTSLIDATTDQFVRIQPGRKTRLVRYLRPLRKLSLRSPISEWRADNPLLNRPIRRV